jgi:non-specific serine/threonine protein kinase
MPDHIGSYRILGEVGVGGMGVVYLGEDPTLERRIAIKVLPPDLASDARGMKRFEREARLLASLTHPNIATIHSLEEAGGVRFLTLELIEGDTLRDRLAGGPLSPEVTISVSRQIASALEAAHKNGIVHRDLKPANIKVTPEGLVKVLDFGIAKAIDPSHTVLKESQTTADGAILGTPGYMSPEQIRGEKIDRRVDLWGFGCIVYECLTGSCAFGGDTPYGRVAATMDRDPDWSALPDGTPEWLRDLLVRCLTKDIDARLDSAVDARRLFEAEIAQQASSTILARRPVRGAASTPNNLPLQLTSFIGREAEMEEIRQLLVDDRLVALTGSGGCGKSRLALEVAGRLLDEFPDGVWFVELAPLGDESLVPHAVASVLGLTEAGQRSVDQVLLDYFRHKRSLLVLDNCEHLIDACAQLSQSLLQTCAGLRLLATSRENLRAQGESLYRVPSLECPPQDELGSPDDLERSGSVLLFLDRARNAHPGFVMSKENAASIAQICRRLDGIPLAIELAAARVKVMSAAEIASRLDDRFRLLTGGDRTAVPRHQTLHALIDWSYVTLEAEEQALLRRLSVFAGGWTLAAAEHVCAGRSIDAWQILDVLMLLIEKSLVEIDGDLRDSGITRYRMLETVREYGRERLEETGETHEARERHRDRYLALAEEASSELRGPGQQRWMNRLETEHENILVALGWISGGGEDAEKALRLAGSMWLYWHVRGHFTLGREILAGVLARDVDERWKKPRSLALHSAGALAHVQGDYDSARALYEESLEIRWELEDRQGIATSLNSLGNLAFFEGNYESARAFHEKSLEIRREMGDRGGIAVSLSGLGNVAQDRGEYESARALHEESLEIQRELGDRQGTAASLINLGRVKYLQGESESARALHEESLEIKRELGDRPGISILLNNLALVKCSEGEYESARALHEESLEIKRELGDRRGIAFSLSNLGFVAYARGEYESARALHEESIEIKRELGDRRGILLSLDGCGQIEAALDHPARCTRVLGASDRIMEQIGVSRTPQNQAEIDGIVSRVHDTLGDEAFAREWAAGQAMSLEEAIDYALGREGASSEDANPPAQ